MQRFTDDNSSEFYGMYRAIVVNNGFDPNEELSPDPEQRGRIQVRVLGIHSQNNYDDPADGIPDINLPWAEPACSLMGGLSKLDSGKVSGVLTVPNIGSWVWVFFDNGDHNKPVYFASIPGNEDFSEIAGKQKTVIRTLSGHVIEVNDVKNQEEISITHSDGNTTVQVKKDTIILYGKTIQVTATEMLTLGTGNRFIVTSDSEAAIQTLNGILTPNPKIKG